MSAFEEELVDLRTVLRQDAASLQERRRRQRRKPDKTGSSSSSSGDSGISDSYELSEQDLPRREEALNRLKAMAKQLEENLPPNSEALQGRGIANYELHPFLNTSVLNFICFKLYSF